MQFPRARAIGEIVYDVMSGLLFYPRTLWRVLLAPAEISGRTGVGAEPTADRVSPPLFLLLSILTAHLLDMTMRVELGEPRGDVGLDLLLFRLAAFSLFPLVMAAGAVRREGRLVDHASLRRPFEQQCLYTAPFAISSSVAGVLASSEELAVRLAGLGLGLAALAWYLSIQTHWLGRRLPVSAFRALGIAMWLFAVALFCCAPAALLILGARG